MSNDITLHKHDPIHMCNPRHASFLLYAHVTRSQLNLERNACALPCFTFHAKKNYIQPCNYSSFIQGRVQISTELKQNRLDEEPVKGAEQIRSVHKVRAGAESMSSLDNCH